MNAHDRALDDKRFMKILDASDPMFEADALQQGRMMERDAKISRPIDKNQG